MPAASPAEACKGRTAGLRRLVSVAFARELLQRRFALCYNHMVCKMIVKESVSISTSNLIFSAAHSDSNIRILFRLKFGTQGLSPSWGAISTFFWDRISITSIWLFLNNSRSTTEEKLAFL